MCCVGCVCVRELSVVCDPITTHRHIHRYARNVVWFRNHHRTQCHHHHRHRKLNNIVNSVYVCVTWWRDIDRQLRRQQPHTCAWQSSIQLNGFIFYTIFFLYVIFTTRYSNGRLLRGGAFMWWWWWCAQQTLAGRQAASRAAGQPCEMWSLAACACWLPHKVQKRQPATLYGLFSSSISHPTLASFPFGEAFLRRCQNVCKRTPRWGNEGNGKAVCVIPYRPYTCVWCWCEHVVCDIAKFDIGHLWGVALLPKVRIFFDSLRIDCVKNSLFKRQHLFFYESKCLKTGSTNFCTFFTSYLAFFYRLPLTT